MFSFYNDFVSSLQVVYRKQLKMAAKIFKGRMRFGSKDSDVVVVVGGGGGGDAAAVAARATAKAAANGRINTRFNDQLRRVAAEVEIARSMRHENIVRYHGYMVGEDYKIITFLEYCDSVSSARNLM
jgi:hypothetical protein